LERLCTRLSATMRKLGDSRAEVAATTRFFRNPKVTAPEIVATAAAHTARVAQGRHVLLIEDTSEINFEAKSGRKRALGTVGNGKDAGLFIHPAIAVDAADGTLLGLAAATIWRRHKRKAEDYQDRPIEQKESHRWIETLHNARAALPDAAVVTGVTDREGDIYELFARVPRSDAPGPQTHLIVRCTHDRALVKDGQQGHRLDERVAGWSPAGQVGIDVVARPGRPARHAVLTVRFGRVHVRQPKRGADPKDPPEVVLNLVEVREMHPPEGQEPVHWRLYTTHAVDTLEDAIAIVELYRRRWIVEQVFRTLKSQGLDIEDSLLSEGEALENLVAAALVAAIKVMQCVQGRGEAGRTVPALRVFTATELLVLRALVLTLQGKTQKQKNRFPPDSLAWATWVIARLGGWTGYASERPPGPITMHDGLTRFAAIAEGFALAQT
jgi:hypothetical protein